MAANLSETQLRFLQDHGFGDYAVLPTSGDAGLRRYYLLTRGDETVLFMDMSRSDYESGLQSYIEVARYLKSIGVRVPDIYASDQESGLSIIEHLGEQSFGDVRAQVPLSDLYGLATDVLVKMCDNGAADNVLGLATYKQTLIYERLSQFVEFYVPAVTGKDTNEEDVASFYAMQDEIEASLPPCPMGLCHADYHLENLIWMPETSSGYGLIDFQDAFWGPLSYDLLNLLEDARQDVPEEIKSAMKDKYCAAMSAQERNAFDQWYLYLSSHFHCRVLGLFIKLYKERGIDQYLQHIPRLQNYVLRNLEEPSLSLLKKWVEVRGITFDQPISL